jgi:hypothetical protein
MATLQPSLSSRQILFGTLVVEERLVELGLAGIWRAAGP